MEKQLLLQFSCWNLDVLIHAVDHAAVLGLNGSISQCLAETQQCLLMVWRVLVLRLSACDCAKAQGCRGPDQGEALHAKSRLSDQSSSRWTRRNQPRPRPSTTHASIPAAEARPWLHQRHVNAIDIAHHLYRAPPSAFECFVFNCHCLGEECK